MHKHTCTHTVQTHPSVHLQLWALNQSDPCRAEFTPSTIRALNEHKNSFKPLIHLWAIWFKLLNYNNPTVSTCTSETLHTPEQQPNSRTRSQPENPKFLLQNRLKMSPPLLIMLITALKRQTEEAERWKGNRRWSEANTFSLWTSAAAHCLFTPYSSKVTAPEDSLN